MAMGTLAETSRVPHSSLWHSVNLGEHTHRHSVLPRAFQQIGFSLSDNILTTSGCLEPDPIRVLSANRRLINDLQVVLEMTHEQAHEISLIIVPDHNCINIARFD
ncbi:hypothetical protein OPQ81_005003 [Rhizoctonia solani]|nr:hypothetical protein OPQ81_005003 [Rhizoctonia solani]